MTDREIATARTQTAETERLARARLGALALDDLAERDAALVVIRQAVALEKVLERWMSARAMRAALQS